MLSIVHQGEGKERRGGLVLKNGVYETIKDCSIESEYDEDYYQNNIKAWAKTDKEEYEIEGRVLSLIPLRNKRKDPEGKMLTTRITEGMTEYSYKGQVGYGMSEYLDQIIKDKPLGP